MADKVKVKDKVKFPEITVVLSEGVDGNAGAILGAVTRALKRHNVRDYIIDDFRREAMSGDYDHLLQTCMKWVNVE